MFQACAYGFAYFVPFTFVLLRSTIEKNANKVGQAFYVLIFPLQGFFNFLLFLYHKVVSHMRAFPDCTLRRAILKCLQSSETPDVIISRMTIVRNRDVLYGVDFLHEDNDLSLGSQSNARDTEEDELENDPANSCSAEERSRSELISRDESLGSNREEKSQVASDADLSNDLSYPSRNTSTRYNSNSNAESSLPSRFSLSWQSSIEANEAKEGSSA